MNWYRHRTAAPVNDWRNVDYFGIEPTKRNPEQNYLNYGHDANDGDALWAWIRGKLVVKPVDIHDPQDALHEEMFKGPEVPLKYYSGRYDASTGVVTLVHSRELPDPPSALMSALHMQFNPKSINMYS